MLYIVGMVLKQTGYSYAQCNNPYLLGWIFKLLLRTVDYFYVPIFMTLNGMATYYFVQIERGSLQND